MTQPSVDFFADADPSGGANGQRDAMSTDNAVRAIAPLIQAATLITPNLLEAVALCDGDRDRRLDTQVETLLRVCPNVLIKGGHGSESGSEPGIVSRWFYAWRHVVVDLDAGAGPVPRHRLHFGASHCRRAGFGQADDGCPLVGTGVLPSDAAVVLCNRGWTAYSESIAFIF